MQNLDKLRLQLDENAIRDIDYSHFIRNELYGAGNDSKKLLKARYFLLDSHKPFGLSDVVVTTVDSHITKAIIEFSSKILKHNYSKLINRNTIEEAVHNINSKAISLDFDNLLKSTVHRVDVTNDLKMDKPLRLYIDALDCYSINHKYDHVRYKNKGIDFTRKVGTKGLKHRLSFYDKEEEILGRGDMLKFIDPNLLKGVLRAEGNFTSFRRMRDYFQVEKEPLLFDILMSSEKVNYKLLSNITNGYKFELFDRYKDGRALSGIETIEGKISICEQLNRNIFLIKNFIKHHIGPKTNPCPYLKKYKDILHYLTVKDSNSPNEHTNLMIEIFQKLLVY